MHRMLRKIKETEHNSQMIITNCYYSSSKIPLPAICPEDQSPSFTVKGAPEIRHEGAVCSSFTLSL